MDCCAAGTKGALGLKQSSDKWVRVALALAFVLGLGVRLAYVAWADGGRFRAEQVYAGDAEQYVELARSIADGEGFRMDERLTSWRAPGYPAFVSLWFRCTERPLLVARIAQALLGALLIPMVYALGRRLHGKLAGLLASLAVAGCYELIHMCAYVMTEALFAVLLLALVMLLAAHQRHAGSWWIPTAAGAVLGLANLVRPSLQLLPVLLLPWFLLVTTEVAAMRGRFARWLVLVGVSAIVVAPWSWRNYRVHGAFMPVTSDTGKVVYGALGPTASGGGGGYYRRGDDYTIPPALDRGSEAEKNKTWTHEGMRYALQHPCRTFALVPRKIWNMWRPWFADTSRASTLAATAFYLPVALLALMGAVRMRKEWRCWSPVWLMFLYTVGLHALLTSTVRYRYPLMPLVILQAASWVAHMLHRNRPCALKQQRRSCLSGAEHEADG